MNTFWDKWAPLYDIAEKTNHRAYDQMLKTVRRLIPRGSSVLETAAGTGSISLSAANKASHVLCTDVSTNMLDIAKRKAIRRGIHNITIEKRSIYKLEELDESFDVVIASQVLHLIDEPEKAAQELRRVSKSYVILPMSFTKNLRGIPHLLVKIYQLLGFRPKREFTPKEYKIFLDEIGFKNCKHIQIAGKIPMAVAIWKK